MALFKVGIEQAAAAAFGVDEDRGEGIANGRVAESRW